MIGGGAKTILDLWPLFLFLTGIIAAWSLIIIATTRWILSRCLSSYDGKIKENGDAARKIEIDILEMKAKLPVEYVRREDHIRYETIVNLKLDKLFEAINKLEVRGAR